MSDHHPLLLDGAMGTELQKRGARPGRLPELLNLTDPALIEGIHRDYAEAGSQVLYANTFGVNRLRLAASGHTVEEVVSAAVAIARRAAAGRARVALDMGPLGALVEPLGDMTFEAAYDLFAEIARAGAKAGADLAVIETMTDLYETRAALLAVKENTDLPVYVTMSFDASGRTFTGCTPSAMARTLEGLGADAVGVNCSLGPREVAPVIREIKRSTRLPVIAKPNAGLPDPTDGHYSLSAADFAQAMRELTAAGAEIIGGCCGTGPEYIRALKSIALPEQTAAYAPCSFLCTPTRPLVIDGVRVIGERINPTGKKRFQQALLEDDLDYIVDVAVRQMDAGADILDVNVGYPGIDEKTMLPRVVKAIQAAVDLPLQIDSTDPEAIEAALRVVNGKAAVNSVTGKEESLRRVLPIVKKYGAAVVGLTLDENGLPDTAEKRLIIARRILDRALEIGIPREDVWIDCLTLTVSAQQEQARETLAAVTAVRREMGLQTLLGVSNISFGLPSRQLITQVFLARALAAGLTLPILNPNQPGMMETVAASRVLSGEDRQSREYIARLGGAQAAESAAPSREITLKEAIVRGLRSDAAQLAKQALENQTEMALVEGVLIPALDQVGAEYEAGRVYLPQLLSAAQAAQAVFEELRLSLLAKGEKRVSRGRLILATVQGDIHDIGKNIVKTVLENYGYEVIDLGKDVPPEAVAQAARRENVRLVGLSALMTTTLPAMEKTVRLLRELPDPPRICVGGAVVTPEYAAAIGADYYAKDAREAAVAARSALG